MNNFFAEHDQATASDYTSIKVVKGELANEDLNYDSKTKAYVPIWARSVSYQKRTVLVKFEQVSEAVVRRCSSKYVFLKTLQIPQENTIKKKFFMNTFFYRTAPVAASDV